MRIPQGIAAQMEPKWNLTKMSRIHGTDHYVLGTLLISLLDLIL